MDKPRLLSMLQEQRMLRAFATCQHVSAAPPLCLNGPQLQPPCIESCRYYPTWTCTCALCRAPGWSILFGSTLKPRWSVLFMALGRFSAGSTYSFSCIR